MIIILRVMIKLIIFGASFHFVSFLLFYSFTFLFVLVFVSISIFVFSSIYLVTNPKTYLNNSNLLAYQHHYYQNLPHISFHSPPIHPILSPSAPIRYLPNYFNQNHLHINYLICLSWFQIQAFSIFYCLFLVFVLVMIGMIRVANLSMLASYI